jgi:Cupin superfamily protein
MVDPVRMAEFDLAAILSPCDVETFLATAWGKSHYYVQGSPDKFSDLLSWQTFNDILAQHRLEPPRLRLSKEGTPADQLNFLDLRTARRGGTIPRIDIERLYKHLKSGATLVLDAIDEMVPAISTTCETLTRIFLTHIQANAYASWGESRGFGLHWDDHDVIIIQIAGSKHWQIFGPTREYPLYRDVELNTERPQTKPVWERSIRAGDVLYVPRGHWHDVVAANEPTLHLTFGINNPNGVDLLEWLADQLRDSALFRRDLPLFATPEEKARHTIELRQELRAKFDDDLVSRFLRDRTEKLRPRLHLSLPHAPSRDPIPSDKSTRIRFSGITHPLIQTDDVSQTVSLHTSGKALTFSAKAEPILRVLLTHKPVALSDLLDISPDISEESIRALLSNLLEQGIIHIVNYDS